ncbi:PH domain-containing protein [Cellulomonas sp. zg-ZUI222]|uniref:PH domain-containing protein n=1 Tax=Cellulomonas wangleii TaxID=2816956 RepID=UPI001A943E1B|nr:PH domain-containing protein [Cellulomonas wangleii]MBO0920259.1 PH domain-containing protein [Cellulomonas wangleii]
MIDFANAAFVKLNEWDPADAEAALVELLLDDEDVLVAFRGIRDSVTFTTKRIVAVNVQGMTGKKKDYTSLPYSRVQAFSVETAGTFDRDTELELWFSGLGLVKLEFGAGVDVRGLSRLLAERCL